MSKKCAKCDKVVYPTEELKCLDKIWHKNCFKCTHCNLLLSMKNYKGFDKQPFCFAHYPQQKPTAVSNNPELARIKENTKFQSNIRYHEDFEKSKGIFTAVADDPETKRILENSRNISQVKYHEEFEKNFKSKFTSVADLETTRAIENQKLVSSAEYKSLKHQHQQPLHQNSGVINTANAAAAIVYPVAKQREFVNSGAPRNIGLIADYDPLNFENMRQTPTSQQQQQQQQHKSDTAYSYSSSSASNFSNQLAHNHHHQLYMESARNEGFDSGGGGADDYSSRIARLNSDIKTSVYKAIYDYDGKEDDELSFRDGDKFINCELIDVGWMIGVHEKTGKHGMFPSNYAEAMDYF